MIELSNRPLIEIRIDKDNPLYREMYEWIYTLALFLGEDEYILLMPHPKHKALDGLSLDEFLVECPEELSKTIRNLYNERVSQRETAVSDNIDEKNTFDLENDFGFILIAFV